MMNLLIRNFLRKDFVTVEEKGNAKLLKFREAMFEWFINVRGVLKGRLPIKMCQSKCQQVYDEWLNQQPETVSE